MKVDCSSKTLLWMGMIWFAVIMVLFIILFPIFATKATRAHDTGFLMGILWFGFFFFPVSIIAVVKFLFLSRCCGDKEEITNRNVKGGISIGASFCSAIIVVILGLFLLYMRVWLPFIPRGVSSYPSKPIDPTMLSPPVNLTIAYVGDTAAGPGAESVYALVKQSGAELLVHVGDYDYGDDPAWFHHHLDSQLGINFTVIAAIGNHDLYLYHDYQQELKDHLDHSDVPGLNCGGILGVDAWCVYRGVYFAFSAASIAEGSGVTDIQYHVEKLERQLQNYATLGMNSNSPWKMCLWHKPGRTFRIGPRSGESIEKSTATGWFDLYELCRRHGAMVMTGHQHNYARTHALQSFVDLTLDGSSVACGSARCSPSCVYSIRNGTSMAAVVGLGGKGTTSDTGDDYGTNPHFGCAYTQKAGALICKYNLNGVVNRAECSFVDIDGIVIDTFGLVAG